MRILITGVGGFVGGHLAQQLAQHMPQATLHGTVLTPPSGTALPGVKLHTLDVCDADATTALLRDITPDQIYHLAGQAFVPRSFEAPWGTFEVNVRGLLNIIQGCLALSIAPRTLVVGSGEVYGAVAPELQPVTEDTPLRPSSPYSVSKAAQDLLALQYHLSHELPLLRVRPFNHVGPGQDLRFVAPAFASQIARIEVGQQDAVLRVGNLEAKRDFTDVRDIVRAYIAVMAHGTPGEAYNIASGQAVSIADVLHTLLAHTRATINIQQDPARMRPAQLPIMVGSAARLRAAVGWQPEIPLATTLRDVLDDCRQRVARAATS